MAEVLSSCDSERKVESSLYFLRRDPIYLTEKVYEFDFDPPHGFPRSNMMLERKDKIAIHDIRGHEDAVGFWKTGFQLVKFDSGMTYSDFDDQAMIRSRYVPAVAAMLQDFLGAARVQIDSCVLRRRHPDFPIYNGGVYKHKQPSALVHIDTTRDGTRSMILASNPTEGSELVQRRHQMVNFWKPIRAGPVRDWPLTLCDPASIDRDADLVARDLLRTGSPLETYQMHHTEQQKWYFASDQQDHEAWLFLQSDSAEEGMAGVPHTSFPFHSEHSNVEPRESVEVRAFVYY